MNRKEKKELEKKLESIFIVSKPIKKTEFLNSLPYKKQTVLDFAFSQLGYIRKRFWILSILLLLVLNIFYLFLQLDKDLICLLSASLPLFTLLSVSEIFKSNMHNMGELETSCKYDLGRLTLARLVIIGSFQFLLVFLLMIIFNNKTQFKNLQFIIYSLTPFLLSTYISFGIANYYKSQESLYVCGGVTITISTLVYLSSFNVQIYSDSYIVVWYVVFFMVVFLLVKEIYVLLNKRGGLWSLA